MLGIMASRSTLADLSKRWKVGGGSRRKVGHGWVRVLPGMWLKSDGWKARDARHWQEAAEFGLYPGKCRDFAACLPPFLFLLRPHRTIVTSPLHPQSPQPKSTDLPPTPTGNLVPAITDDIFPAHSGSRASPLHILLPSVYCWFVSGTTATGMWQVSHESLCFCFRYPPSLAHSEAALKWQRGGHWHNGEVSRCRYQTLMDEKRLGDKHVSRNCSLCGVGDTETCRTQSLHRPWLVVVGGW
jgi:hypothetical protein